MNTNSLIEIDTYASEINDGDLLVAVDGLHLGFEGVRGEIGKFAWVESMTFAVLGKCVITLWTAHRTIELCMDSNVNVTVFRRAR